LPVPRDEGTDLQWRNTADRYGLIGQALHWFVAIGIVAPGMVRPAAVSSAESEQESARRAARNPLQPAGRVAVVHILAALKHQLIDRDGVLRSMLPWWPRPRAQKIR